MDGQNQLSGSKTPDHPFYKKIDRTVTILNKIIHHIAMVVLFLMMCLTTFDVIGRAFFNNPISGSYELMGLGLVMIVFLSLGMTQLKGGHISIDFITNKFPGKVQEVLNIFTSFIVVLILMIMTWQLLEYANRVSGQTTGEIAVPLDIFAVLAAVGVLLFAFANLLSLLKSMIKVVQKYEP